MVCSEEQETLCVIQDPSPHAILKKFLVKVRSHYTVEKLYDDVGLQATTPNFDLVLQLGDEAFPGQVFLSEKRHLKLTDVGINFNVKRNNLLIVPSQVDYYSSADISIEADMSVDDNLALGASASPIYEETSSNHIPPSPPLPALLFSNTMTTTAPADSTNARTSWLRRQEEGECSQSASPTNYRGLVNQAMTCYLNSLLQALFMTPEFRNALYKWEFDGNGGTKSIPYQLQKLFVNLQTSPKTAVETTDLTRSFGWDSAEGWQQHDIQELCRVMFDALEQKFKNTKQADLINRLYEGKMIDYVKCLECNTEKQREDKFLDIPLPVRPFGSTVAYESIEEALRAFVQPEILDGNNQYHCETCNKKCDAHKGLKFTKFPYILTLHLKRFDFDYSTFHRIKLNDKVTFPQSLNLNSFINAIPSVNGSASAGEQQQVGVESSTVNGTNGQPSSGEMMMETAENFMKTYDECSTTDSGSALEEDSAFQNGTPTSSTTSTVQINKEFIAMYFNEGDLENGKFDDEGIGMDMNGDMKSPSMSNFNAPGPYVYDLFAIMIHSGSASGGHYYAYIKDFSNGKWYSFNDQTVSLITHDDIQKSFGGMTSKSYYSGAYSSSTNAYMLMYRQVDPTKNALPIKEEEFPEHIKKLVGNMREVDTARPSTDTDGLRIKVHFENPKTHKIRTDKLFLLGDATVQEALEEAYRASNASQFVPIEQCRLVSYDRQNEIIESSFDGYERKLLIELMGQQRKTSELLLEIRQADEEFEPYMPNGIMTKVYVVDVDAKTVDGPLTIRTSRTQSVLEFKMTIARKLHVNPKCLILAVNEYNMGSRILTNNDCTLAGEGLIEYCKVFVAVNNPSETDTPGKLVSMAARLDHIIAIYIEVPILDADTRKQQSIPEFSDRNAPCAPAMNGFGSAPAAAVTAPIIENAPDPRSARIAAPAPRPMNTGMVGVNFESYSDDGSLSDNDRTLVEETVEVERRVLDRTNQCLLTKSSDMSPDSSPPATLLAPTRGEMDEDELEEEAFLAACRSCGYYCKVIPLDDATGSGVSPQSDSKVSSSNGDTEKDNSAKSKELVRIFKVLIDKRADHRYLKYRLQWDMNVPMDYFTLTNLSTMQEVTMLKEELNAYSDGSRLSVGYGRVLRKGEFKISFFYLNLNHVVNDLETLPALTSWVIRKHQKVGHLKRELLDYIVANFEPYRHLTYERCRLRKRGWRCVSKVFTDDMIIGEDVHVTNYSDMVLQEVDDLPNVTPLHYDDVVLLIRRWLPSEMKLGKFEEIILRYNSDLKAVLSKHSGIPEENLEFTKTQFRDSVSLLQLHEILQCSGSSTRTDSGSLQDGHVIYYRDKTEPLMEMTAEERKELTRKDIRSSTTYSTRKERALKIYVDVSPKKADD